MNKYSKTPLNQLITKGRTIGQFDILIQKQKNNRATATIKLCSYFKRMTLRMKNR